jgi:hypothetical protein
MAAKRDRHCSGAALLVGARLETSLRAALAVLFHAFAGNESCPKALFPQGAALEENA